MSKKEDDAKRDAVLLRMLKTPPKKHAPLGINREKKPKPSRGKPANLQLATKDHKE